MGHFVQGQQHFLGSQIPGCGTADHQHVINIVPGLYCLGHEGGRVFGIPDGFCDGEIVLFPDFQVPVVYGVIDRFPG